MKATEDFQVIEWKPKKQFIFVGGQYESGYFPGVVVEITETAMLVCYSKGYTMCSMCDQSQECPVSDNID